MKSKIKIVTLVISIIILTSGILLAESGIITGKQVDDETKDVVLTLKTDEENNTATLKWINDNYGSFDYRVEKIYDKDQEAWNEYFQIFALPEEPIKVLNVSPNSSKLLYTWMEENGYGKELIDVTTVNIDDFSNSFKGSTHNNNELVNEDGEYKYEIIVFGTADSNGSKDISAEAETAVEKFINEGHSVIFGHDTIAAVGTSSLNHPNFAKLKEYVNLELANSWSSSGYHSDYVTIAKDGNVFTSYPHNIKNALQDIPTNYYPEDNQKQGLKIPTSHVLGQTAKGTIWLKFAYKTQDPITYGNNFYLTTYQKEGAAECAMIQTGHSNGTATPAEQQIFANLIFYLWYQNTTKSNLSLVDVSFTDIDAPETPVVDEVDDQDIDLNTKTANIKFSINDKGTEYNWYVDAMLNGSEEDKVIRSNIVNATRTTGIEKYQYFVDGNATATAEDFKDTSKIKEITKQKVSDGINYPNSITETINCEIANYEKTYLHIRAIDGAKNEGTIKDELIYTNQAPVVSNVKAEPTIWTNKNVNITFDTSDVDGTVNKAESLRDKDENKKLLITNNTFSVSENGTYAIKATDNLGKESELAEATVNNIDETDPTGSFTTNSDENGELTETINFTAKDTISGIKEIKLVVDDDIANAKLVYSNNMENNGKTPGEKEITKDINIPDESKCKVIITDYAGNQTEVHIKMASGGVSVVYRDYNDYDNTTQGFGKTEITGDVGDPYTTSEKEIEGYELLEKPSNATGRLGRKNQKVIYEYKKISYLTTKYVDEETGKELEKESYTKYLENEELKLLEQMIEGYQPVGYVIGEYKVGDEILGLETLKEKMKKENVTITIVYKKVSEGLVVKYVDKITNEQLDLKTYTGVVDKEIKLEKLNIEGYQLVESPKETSIKLTLEPQEVVFYYKKIVNIRIVGIDEKTGKEIYSNETTLKGLEGESYTSTAPEIKGYKLDKNKMPANAKGKYDRKDTKIVYFYNKIAGGVKVRYVDENGKDIVENVVISGVIDEPYTTEYKEFSKYKLASIDGNTIGKMTENEIVVTYYYEKKIGKVEVKHVDEQGNVLYSEEIEDYIEEKYKTNYRDFDNYTYDRVDGVEEGYIEERPKVITYYYKSINAKEKDNTPKTGTKDIIDYVSIIAVISIIGIIVFMKDLW